MKYLQNIGLARYAVGRAGKLQCKVFESGRGMLRCLHIQVDGHPPRPIDRREFERLQNLPIDEQTAEAFKLFGLEPLHESARREAFNAGWKAGYSAALDGQPLDTQAQRAIDWENFCNG